MLPARNSYYCHGLLVLDADLSIPAPTLRFFGIGNFPPAGVDPSRLGEAQAHVILQTTLTHPDGSKDSAEPLIYGLSTFRIPLTGVLVAIADITNEVIPRFDEPDGSFGFRLPDRVENDFHIADIGPGDTLEFNYIFSTFASTGFGETSAFAAIGDPFDISLTGGRFNFTLSDNAGPVPSASPVPEPGTVVMMTFGFIVLAGLAARHSLLSARKLPLMKSN
ncbi:MAG TPA: PEP-CTERM sorting domain-containing protein [Candidatus Udaeobacter sp.]|nr:PEP-CTERM sorting domain-containing protein [Candidatus Udaeobacter sp.]